MNKRMKNHTATFKEGGKVKKMEFSTDNPDSSKSALKRDAKSEYRRRGGDLSEIEDLDVD
ncbi:hypothetical protein [Carboxylicivirga linearis]|uniref:Uncharacterized protein n=1 Tax=Carboxylicivirga linearis TaxID=1628157 RepID=A0ABS5JZS5_9BACT|nr:hypothetical protein [Carboxylicivirga linearis]MBS2100407.1 hypothetical protein [Carboxylicivirga linearis]